MTEYKYTTGCGACGPAVQAQTSCSGELGPEWDYDSYGTCGDCQFNCVSFGALGTACTTGTHAKCKRIAYLGDKTSCCLGTGPGHAQYTCDPSYLPSNANCDAVYTAYCTGDKIVKDAACLNWRNLRPAAAAQTLQSYCLANLNTPECRTWCKAQADSGNGVCDAAMINWCSTHPTDALCTCIRSPLQDPKYGINPKCNDKACLDTGYVTQNMRNTNCPDITNCDVQSALVNSGVQLAGVTINQNCGAGANVTSPTGTSAAPSGGTTTVSAGAGTLAPTTPSMNVTVLYLFILLVLIAVVLGAGAWYMFADDHGEVGL